MNELSLVIPFYNEEKNLSAFLSNLVEVFSSKKVNYEIVAVNNGSRDSTGALLQGFAKKNKRIRVVTVPVNQGYGYGIIHGLDTASGTYVGYCWGDGQITAVDTLRVFETLKATGVDICKIKRVSRQDSAFRKMESLIYNLIYNVLFSLRLHDINGCPKIMKRSVLLELKPESWDWFIDAELMVKAFRKNFKVLEVPVTYHKREKGKSHVRLTTALEFVRNAIRFKMRGY